MPLALSYSLLGLHLALMSVLCLFGLHRLRMVLRWFRLLTAKPEPLRRFYQLPRVTIQLPIFNERNVLGRLLAHVTAIDYPRELLEIQVLDDSTDSTRTLAARLIAQYRGLGIDISHLTRPHRNDFKAGALAEGMKRAGGEFIAVFDADFLPQPGFLETVIHYFTDPQVGMVQCCWDHINRSASPLTRAQALLLDGHFQIEHTVRSRSGNFFNFNGTAGIWRKSAIEEAGGWQGDTLTEDLDLSYRSQLACSRFVYLADWQVAGELPSDLPAFKSQQQRWTKGSVQVFRKLWPRIFRAPITSEQRREAFFHLSANFCYPMLFFAGILIWPTMEAYQHLMLHAPGHPSGRVFLMISRAVFLLAFGSVILFYAAAAKAASRKFFETAIDIPLALCAGAALSLSNSVAVFEGLSRRRGTFLVTPKSGASAGRLRRARVLQNGSGRRPAVSASESLLAAYFAFTALRGIELQRFEALPFILLFTCGFLWFAGAELYRWIVRLFLLTPFLQMIRLRLREE